MRILVASRRYPAASFSPRVLPGRLFRLFAAAILFSTASWAQDQPSARIEFGIQVAPEDATYEHLIETAQLIEALGYDSFWLNDHLMPLQGDPDQSQLESWMLLTAIATETERIRLGHLVSSNTFRHPAVLAKMATTLDHISRGRLNFGIGAGWAEAEHRAYGIPFFTARQRAERLGETLEVITRLWNEEHPSVDGEHYQLHRAPFAPEPLQQPHPPIVIGGKGKQWIMPLVARYADEWNVAVGVGPDGIRERMRLVREECARLGREPCVRGISAFLPLANLTNVPLAGPVTRLGARLLFGSEASTSVLAGSAEEIIEKIRTYVDAGVTHVIITTRPAINHDLMRRFAAEIVPAFRESTASSARR